MPKTIMTVDDSNSVRQMVALTLRQQGFDIVEAVDGLDALQKIKNQPVDMLITDLNMPNCDGISLIEQVRAMASFKFLPILFLTTESSDEKKQKAKACGATGWIVKPFKPEQLVQVVKKVLP